MNINRGSRLARRFTVIALLLSTVLLTAATISPTVALPPQEATQTCDTAYVLDDADPKADKYKSIVCQSGSSTACAQPGVVIPRLLRVRAALPPITMPMTCGMGMHQTL